MAHLEMIPLIHMNIIKNLHRETVIVLIYYYNMHNNRVSYF